MYARYGVATPGASDAWYVPSSNRYAAAARDLVAGVAGAEDREHLEADLGTL
jgi:hypothetical protein